MWNKEEYDNIRDITTTVTFDSHGIQINAIYVIIMIFVTVSWNSQNGVTDPKFYIYMYIYIMLFIFIKVVLVNKIR